MHLKIYGAYLKAKKNYGFLCRRVSDSACRSEIRVDCNRLVTALIDANLRDIKHMVLTVSGSGVFSNSEEGLLASRHNMRLTGVVTNKRASD